MNKNQLYSFIKSGQELLGRFGNDTDNDLHDLLNRASKGIVGLSIEKSPKEKLESLKNRLECIKNIIEYEKDKEEQLRLYGKFDYFDFTIRKQREEKRKEKYLCDKELSMIENMTDEELRNLQIIKRGEYHNTYCSLCGYHKMKIEEYSYDDYNMKSMISVCCDRCGYGKFIARTLEWATINYNKIQISKREKDYEEDLVKRYEEVYGIKTDYETIIDIISQGLYKMDKEKLRYTIKEF